MGAARFGSYGLVAAALACGCAGKSTAEDDRDGAGRAGSVPFGGASFGGLGGTGESGGVGGGTAAKAGTSGSAGRGASGSTGGTLEGSAGAPEGGVAGTTTGGSGGSVVEPIAACGNGIIDATGEECDDGNPYPGDGCDGTCRREPQPEGTCGDGTRGPNEQCDDANTRDDDGCSSDCTLEEGFACPIPGEPCHGGEVCDDCDVICGDGIVARGEECDDGENPGGYNRCQSDCTWGSRCGDGITDTEQGELCDLGGDNLGEYGACAVDCRMGPRCGDAVVQSDHEQCDDGVNDGRYGTCAPGCVYGPHCGDGVIQPENELCDDGNDVTNDGCSFCMLDR